MNTRDLIDSLARDARPVRPLPGVGWLMAGFALATVAVAIGIASFRPRADLATELRGAPLPTITALLLVAAFALAVVPAVLARPTFRRLRTPLYLAGAAAGVALVVMGVREAWTFGPNWVEWTGLSFFCSTGAVLFSALPFAGGVWLLRRGASVHPVRSGILIGLASAGLGAIAEMWSCDINLPTHVISGHVLIPALILAGLGALAGWRWLRW